MYSGCYVTTTRWEDIPDAFLGNGSINAFPLLDSRFFAIKQLDFNNGRAVFSTWSVPRGYKYGDLALQVGRVSNLRQ
jgi:hypothetical protein